MNIDISVSAGPDDRDREQARKDQEPIRVDPHRRQRVDLGAHFHRAELGGDRRAGAAGQDDRGHQRAELADHRQADHVGDEHAGAEPLQLRSTPWNPIVIPSRNDSRPTMNTALKPISIELRSDGAGG